MAKETELLQILKAVAEALIDGSIKAEWYNVHDEVAFESEEDNGEDGVVVYTGRQTITMHVRSSEVE